MRFAIAADFDKDLIPGFIAAPLPFGNDESCRIARFDQAGFLLQFLQTMMKSGGNGMGCSGFHGLSGLSPDTTPRPMASKMAAVLVPCCS